ncbi:chorismate-binding protein [Nostocoides sp. Soil756]|uniref:chorismate-binding protein n=1 Tax=Nostocoides sp. Soil756 TaxID=1736399 RepID=UPI0006F3A9E0|nr:chorismate-binding protein [Tetrasphaera sp. Soil756]KRE62921.1 chloride transporter [Tetrasphaera sp. Soil756]
MAEARFGSVLARGVEAVSHDVEDLDRGGFWVVVRTFEGGFTAVRMAQVRRGVPMPRTEPDEDWPALEGEWRTTLDEAAYRAGVDEVRRRVAAGTVYQVNLCRVLEHDLPDGASLAALGQRLARGNPAPYSATIDLPEAGLEVACASPELFLRRRGERLTSGPIKGTARTAAGLLAKDFAENVMIVDLVRHDLASVCRPGTVEVDALCRLEEHPGLVHLVSEVSGRLRPGVGWREVMAATFPPGSVSGAPKHTALQAIADLEPVPRGPYCGAVGWVDADRSEASLAVGIRTFWAGRRDDGRRVLRFGTGAGITWGSSAASEWEETVLKAARLVALAGGRHTTSGRVGP